MVDPARRGGRRRLAAAPSPRYARPATDARPRRRREDARDPRGPAVHRRARVGCAPRADTVRVGITDYAQDALGDIVFVTLPEVGAEVRAGETCGEVESTKSVSRHLRAGHRHRRRAQRRARQPRRSWSTPTRTATAGCSRSGRRRGRRRRRHELLDAAGYQSSAGQLTPTGADAPARLTPSHRAVGFRRTVDLDLGWRLTGVRTFERPRPWRGGRPDAVLHPVRSQQPRGQPLLRATAARRCAGRPRRPRRARRRRSPSAAARGRRGRARRPSGLSAADQAAVDALPPGSALLVVRRGPNAGSRFLLDTDVDHGRAGTRTATSSSTTSPCPAGTRSSVRDGGRLRRPRRRQPQRHLRQPRADRRGRARRRRRGADRQVPAGLLRRAAGRRGRSERVTRCSAAPSPAGR